MTRKKMPKKEAMGLVAGLFNKAKDAFDKNPERANKFVHKARRTAMKYKMKLPANLKRRVCKHCYAYLVPSKNCRVRIKEGKVVYYCFSCKRHTRIGYGIRKK